MDDVKQIKKPQGISEEELIQSFRDDKKRMIETGEVPVDILFQAYWKVEKKEARRYKKGEISFLEYQANTYSAIDKICDKWKLKGKPRFIRQASLEGAWLYSDRLMNDIPIKADDTRSSFFPPSTADAKALTIARFLAQEFSAGKGLARERRDKG
jgi:hypothetical protein